MNTAGGPTPSLWTDDEFVPSTMEILESKVEATKAAFAAELRRQSTQRHAAAAAAELHAAAR